MVERGTPNHRQSCAIATAFPSAHIRPCTVRRLSRVSRSGLPVFLGVELQDEFAYLRAELPQLALVDGLLIFAPRLEPPIAGGHKRLHPRVDLGLLEVVLAARINELRLAPEQLQQ